MQGKATSKITRNLLNSLAIILIVLLVSTCLIAIANESPLKAYKAFWFGIFGTMNGFVEIFVKATPLIFAGLGIAIAFKSGFFNIGAEGQLYMGAIGATIISICLTDIPGPLRLMLSIITGFLFGGVWALIPGLLKAKFNISEIITTIMFNYIAINITALAVRGALKEEGYLPQTPLIESSARLPELLLPTRLHAGFLLALLMVWFIWCLMEKTKMGYELQVVGLNKRAAQCTGVSVMKNIIRSAFLSGGLAGLAGMSEVLGIQYRLLDGISGGCGYTAILVALLGGNNPIGVLAAALGFATLQVGSNTMQRQLGIPVSIVLIILGLIVLLILAKDFFFKQGIFKRIKRGEEKC